MNGPCIAREPIFSYGIRGCLYWHVQVSRDIEQTRRVTGFSRVLSTEKRILM